MARENPQKMIYYLYAQCENNYASQHETALRLRERLFSVLNITSKVYIADTKRPCLKDVTADFSVSHSKNLAICAVVYKRKADVPNDIHVIDCPGSRIGIDTEFCDPSPDTDKLFRIAKRYLGKEPADPDEFYTLWTRREAFGKLLGEGVFCHGDDSSSSYFTFSVDVGSDKYKTTICVN